MQKLVSDSLRILSVFVFSFAFAIQFTVSAQSPFVDDASIKRTLETRLNELREDTSVPRALTIRQSLASKKRLPDVKLEPPAIRDEDALQQASAATVIIARLYYCDEAEDWKGSFASGAILSSDGLALTNLHVLDYPEAVVFGAMTRDGKVFAIESVLGHSRQDDLVLVQLRDASDLTAFPIADQIEQGDSVSLISHPDRHFFTLSRGYLSRFHLDVKTGGRRQQITAPFGRGSSGAGVFNDNGELVGLATSTNSIYYEQDDEIQRDLQMVVHSCVSLAAIRAFLGLRSTTNHSLKSSSAPTSQPGSDRATSEGDDPHQP